MNSSHMCYVTNVIWAMRIAINSSHLCELPYGNPCMVIQALGPPYVNIEVNMVRKCQNQPQYR